MWGCVGLLLASLCLTACGGAIYPITETIQTSNVQLSQAKRVAKTYVIWGENKTAVDTVTSAVIKSGGHVLDRSFVERAMDGQLQPLRGADEDKELIVKTGRSMGSDLVLFVETKLVPESRGTRLSSYYDSDYGSGVTYNQVYEARVTLRAIATETGERAWTTRASYPKPIDNADQGVVFLARSAILRALCEYEWDDKQGCVKPRSILETFTSWLVP